MTFRLGDLNAKERDGVWLSDLTEGEREEFAEAFYDSKFWYGHPDYHEDRMMGYPLTYGADAKIEGSIKESAVKYAKLLKDELLEMAEIRLCRYEFEIEQIKEFRGTPNADLLDDYETLKRDLGKLNKEVNERP